MVANIWQRGERFVNTAHPGLYQSLRAQRWHRCLYFHFGEKLVSHCSGRQMLTRHVSLVLTFRRRFKVKQRLCCMKNILLHPFSPWGSGPSLCACLWISWVWAGASARAGPPHSSPTQTTAPHLFSTSFLHHLLLSEPCWPEMWTPGTELESVTTLHWVWAGSSVGESLMHLMAKLIVFTLFALTVRLFAATICSYLPQWKHLSPAG